MKIVGKKEKKVVSDLNNEIFKEAKKIFQKDMSSYYWHMGWQHVGAFIDWLEDNYEIKKKREK